mgnify:CR=1 FL=1
MKTQWLIHAPPQSLQQALKELERAYANSFEGRAAPPAFKKRDRHPAPSMVGVDLGVVNLAKLSTGEIVAPVNALAKRQRQLARAQRDPSRKRKLSRNWIKARARIQEIHTRVGHTRRDSLHKLTTTLSKNHAAVVIEDLQVRNMTRSASGTADQPEQNVRAQSGLNRSILDQGWGEVSTPGCFRARRMSIDDVLENNRIRHGRIE